MATAETTKVQNFIDGDLAASVWTRPSGRPAASGASEFGRWPAARP